MTLLKLTGSKEQVIYVVAEQITALYALKSGATIQLGPTQVGVAESADNIIELLSFNGFKMAKTTKPKGVRATSQDY